MHKNILHIVAGNINGGAARGAYWLHQGLLKLNYNSKMLISGENNISDPTVTSIAYTPIQKLTISLNARLDQIPTKLYKNKQRTAFSTGFKGYKITKHELVEWADIIHLHWINGGFIDIKQFSKFSKPLVWTMRDMWPLTGGCHYSFDCDNFKTGCGSCIQLGSKRDFDLSSYIVKRKLKYFPKTLKIVGISPWLSEKANSSKVFSGYNIETIFNNVNCLDFFPIEKNIARNVLGLKTKKKIILTGAQNIKDYYKGFGKFIEAMKYLDKHNIYLMFFGKLDDNILQNLGFEYKNFGFVHDLISLRMIYSAADIFVAPSIIEAFGKTLIEAMACETPVVCFDATGPKDIVDHKKNGYKSKPFDEIDLANGIQWILDSKNYKQLCINARDKVKKEFDSIVIAKKYIELYKLTLKNK